MYLDNPIWHALTNQQAAFALGDGLARRYPRAVAPFGAVVANNEEALASLASVITPLSLTDVPAMLELVELTHPGPFLPRTIALGRYWAIWQDGRLAAMVGERFHLPGFREISAVCTHPAFQRRGYARQLMLALMREIRCDGDAPILHVFSDNQSAITLYETLGFRQRAELTLSVLERT